MTAVRHPAGQTPATLDIAARIAGISSRILSSIESDDLEGALRLTEERGRLIAGLVASGASGLEIKALLSDARRTGQQALSSATRRATELEAQLSSIGAGRSGITAYDPRARGGSLDVSR